MGRRIGRWTYIPEYRAWKLDHHSWFLQSRSLLDHSYPKYQRGFWCGYYRLGPPYQRYRLYKIQPWRAGQFAWEGDELIRTGYRYFWAPRPPSVWDRGSRLPEHGFCTHQDYLKPAMYVAERALVKEAERAINYWAISVQEKRSRILRSLASLGGP